MNEALVTPLMGERKGKERKKERKKWEEINEKEKEEQVGRERYLGNDTKGIWNWRERNDKVFMQSEKKRKKRGKK
ncbi:hypothetical protein C7212DRAFT_321162 [Tuber magnatum]|uniref:Uncharacterized protein n=1 Tax=Tuber magnatum TaxID=42249 RepID=A0A317SR45_9PEZI|nr:hypothetical protein C7212DRAFT_321162 [Tuber magnatum]